MPPTISEAEWEVMRVLWSKEPLTASQIIKELTGKVDWKPKTVRSLLSRLNRKGAIGFDSKGRQYLYRPLVSFDECVREETQTFLQRFFDGSLAPMVAQLAGDGALSRSEVDALRKILKEDKPCACSKLI